jgi:hypothetical protein
LPKIRVDFSKVQSYDVLPEGGYPAVLEETEVRSSNSSDYPYVNWQFKITTGEHAGRKQWLMTSTSPNAAWALRAALAALGETDESIVGSNEQGVDIDPDDYLGRECVINVIQETYNNELRNKIENLSPLAAPTGSRPRQLR